MSGADTMSDIENDTTSGHPNFDAYSIEVSRSSLDRAKEGSAIREIIESHKDGFKRSAAVIVEALRNG